MFSKGMKEKREGGEIGAVSVQGLQEAAAGPVGDQHMSNPGLL